MNKLIGLIMGAGIAFGGAFCANVNASYQQTQNPQQRRDIFPPLRRCLFTPEPTSAPTLSRYRENSQHQRLTLEDQLKELSRQQEELERQLEEETIIQQLTPESPLIPPDHLRQTLSRQSIETLRNKANLDNALQCSPSVEAVIQTKCGQRTLKINLSLPQKLQDHIYRIVEQIKSAVQRLYANDCYIRTDDIRIVIKRTDAPMDTIEYMPAGNIIEINSSQIDINSSQLDKVDLTDAIAHGLMHKYSFQCLGYLPKWLAEGLATQFEKSGCYDSRTNPPVDELQYFTSIIDFPRNYASSFYNVSQNLIKSFLKGNRISLGQLIVRLYDMLRQELGELDENLKEYETLQEKANVVLKNYILKNGGTGILIKKFKFPIEASWPTDNLKTTQRVAEQRKAVPSKNNQEKKPKKVEPKIVLGKYNKKPQNNGCKDRKIALNIIKF